MTPEVIKKLEDGAQCNLNDPELALDAGISYQTLRNYYDQHPEFLSRIEALRNRPSIKAKKIKCKQLDEDDGDTAEWWLERRNKEEFSTKQETVNKEEVRVRFEDLNEVDGADADKIVGFVLGRIKK